MVFECDSCGLCCEHVADHPDVQHVGGVCVKFDRETRKCSDYENRPSICNVCKTYELYAKDHTEDEYLAMNYRACEYLKAQYLYLIGGTA